MSSALMAKHRRRGDFDDTPVRALDTRGLPDDIMSKAVVFKRGNR
jgi:hypothetical protein